MGKNPAFQFYPNDWARDLEEHPLEIEGAWIRICCKLWWSTKRGSVTRALQQWARILREPLEKTLYVLQYIQAENIGYVTPGLQNFTPENLDCNVSVTVESRRMTRDEKDRELTRLRVKKFREKQPCNDPVTPMKQRSSSSSSSVDTKVSIVETDNGYSLENAKRIISYLNKKTGKNFKSNTKSTVNHIKARFNEKFKLEDFKLVIDNQATKWKSDPKMVDYLRPETLFGTKFESYLQTKPAEIEVTGKTGVPDYAD